MNTAFVRDLLCSELQKSTRCLRGFHDALPRTIRCLNSLRFQEVVRDVYRSGSSQLERLHEATRLMGISYNGESSPFMDVLAAEFDCLAEEGDPVHPACVDAQVACLLRKASHQLMASHRCVLMCARILKLSEIEAILLNVLEQELENDSRIARIADWVISASCRDGWDEVIIPDEAETAVSQPVPATGSAKLGRRAKAASRASESAVPASAIGA